MKTGGKILLLTTLAGGALYGVSAFKRQQQLVNESSVRLQGSKISFPSASRARISSNLVFTNKSAYSFRIINHLLNIYLNDNYISTVSNTGMLRVNANSDSIIPVETTVELSQIVGHDNVLSSIQSGFGNILLQLKGRIYIQHSVFYLGIPVDISYRISELIPHLL